LVTEDQKRPKYTRKDIMERAEAHEQKAHEQASLRRKQQARNQPR
jgi:hypothetical protein